jgi:branched-chain amino acid transport system permease protein
MGYINYEWISISLLNGISYGLLLFLLSSGLTLILSMMGVLNVAHASFYMLGAYVGYTLNQYANFWVALIIAPVIVGTLGAVVEKYGLRRLHKLGHISELLFTFGITFITVELVQLFWGRNALPFHPPLLLEGVAFIVFNTNLPIYKLFMMLVSILVLGVLLLCLHKTRIGLIIQASLTHPEAVQALGHNVPQVFMGVFGGGVALAALAGVIAGPAFITDPAMASSVGPIIFVIIVIGGMGSLLGAFIASLLVGCLQNFAVASEFSVLNLCITLGCDVPAANTLLYSLISLKLSQVSAVLPYIVLIGMLVFKPKGLLGVRDN